MTTDTLETLREKAQKTVEARFERIPAFEWFEDPMCISDLANAALDAVGFDALLKEREAMRDALRWYATQGWRMGDAIMAHDNQAALAVMKDIAVDNGSRAQKALQEQTQ